MSETNKSYRIRTKIGSDNQAEQINISEDLLQEYDSFEILSVNITNKDAYRLHNSNHGIVVGRVLANNGFGIPNAKVSIFVKVDNAENQNIKDIYPYSSTLSKDDNDIRYNLLPNEQINGCHQVVGTFPSKRYALDNDVILEVFDKYYKYTAKTNNAGDYLICGVPVGTHTLHMDLDLSDCGILSQKPRDFVYKGYTIEQFESPTKFKGGTDYGNLSQIFSQDQVINVSPFWGNESLGEPIGITRADIDVNFKFEPTCVFMGSIFSDNSSNGFSRKCIPTDNMGMMEELVTGEGTIEMIRKTPGGDIEEFSIKGNKLINADGVWCYQIPMNLDYMMTDEYGNMVPTDNPERGIPTRASVRFRFSMDDHEENSDNFFRGKVLVPHNPQLNKNGVYEDYDYNFGTYTRDDSFRDLYWNNVYSVKSYIPRIQRSKNPKRTNYSGIKSCNHFGGNNPLPYNNIRIRMPLIFMILCVLIKCYVLIVKIYNTVLTYIGYLLAKLSVKIKWVAFNLHGSWKPWKWCVYSYCVMKNVFERARRLHLVVLKDGLCPDLENWFFAPSFITDKKYYKVTENCRCKNFWGDCCSSSDNITDDYDILQQTLNFVISEGDYDDPKSIDDQNEDPDDAGICLTKNTDYLIACVEMNLAQEYKVINFDFYNDWINGAIYNPRWVRYTRPKQTFFGITIFKEKVRGCMDDPKIFGTARKYTQQCAIGYETEKFANLYELYTKIVKPPLNTLTQIGSANRFHKRSGMKQTSVFGSNGGICHEATTLKKQKVYYLKPCEKSSKTKINLFATDIILLGSFNDCDLNGIPQAFKHLIGTTYIMPTNLALTNMDTNGPLYADGSNTICIGKATSSTGNILSDQINEIQGSALTLTSEYKFYDNTTNYSLNETKDNPGGIELDTLALTEAAGIAWNFTGPGQGSINKYQMYYPGGHFLGISCINSQTNIKSCINLGRICEIGTTMSQRKEFVKGIDDEHFKYEYIAPSGFISGDEIVDSDFRSMFATMNKKRLIATKINPKTGYKYYDFEFSNALNFDGSFSQIAKEKTCYNMTVSSVTEENLTKWGVLSGSQRNDFDADEPINTIIKTKEKTDIDYYLFRFGLSYNEAEDNNILKNKFKNITNGDYFLPQYENSFYFYFGLKNGSTALDEFNRQFYSECENITFREEKKLTLSKNLKFCDGNGKIIVDVHGYTLPLKKIIIEKKDDESFYQVIEGGEFTTGTTGHNILISEVFNLIHKIGNTYDENFEFGTYIITIIDADDDDETQTISLGVDLISFNASVHNFNKPITSDGNTDSSIYRGGFIEIEDLNIRGVKINELYTKELILSYDDDNYTYSSTYNDEPVYLYGKYKDIKTKISFKYQCNENANICWMPLGIYNIKDNSDIRLNLGTSELYYDVFNGLFKSEVGPLTNSSTTQTYEVNVMDIMFEDWWWSKMNIGNSLLVTVNDNTVKQQIWRCFFRHIFYKQESGPFKLHAFAENGKKIIWGSPQNEEVFEPETYSSYEELPEGYVLDDSAIYFPTYGVQYPNGISQFSIQVYNDTDVAGDYHGTMMDGAILFTDDDTYYYHNGYGCIFKPLPDGKLKFIIYDDSNNYENMKDELVGYTNGVFYPTFIFPVIKRFIKFRARFAYWDWLEMTQTIEDNVRTVYVNNEDRGRSMLLAVTNGITKAPVDNTTKGRMDILKIGDVDVTDSMDFTQQDGYGITLTASTDLYEVNKFISDTSNDSSLTDNKREIYYRIKEASPLSGTNFDKIVLNYEYGTDYCFPEILYADLVPGTNYITGLTPSERVDSDVEYFLAYFTQNYTNIIDFVHPKKISNSNKCKLIYAIAKYKYDNYSYNRPKINFLARFVKCDNPEVDNRFGLTDEEKSWLVGREVNVEISTYYTGITSTTNASGQTKCSCFMGLECKFEFYDKYKNFKQVVGRCSTNLSGRTDGYATPTNLCRILCSLSGNLETTVLYNMPSLYFPFILYPEKEITNVPKISLPYSTGVPQEQAYGQHDFFTIAEILTEEEYGYLNRFVYPAKELSEITMPYAQHNGLQALTEYKVGNVQDAGEIKNNALMFGIARKVYQDESGNNIKIYKIYRQIRYRSSMLLGDGEEYSLESQQ